MLATTLFLAAIAIDGATDGDWVTRLGGTATRGPQGEIIGLELRGTWVADADLRSIASLASLKSLDLSHTLITDIGFQTLKSAPAIEELNLYYAEQVGDGVATVIKGWKKLKKLNMRGTKITDLGVAQLAGHPALEWIDVGYSLFTDNGFDPLVSIPRLKHAAVGGNQLTDVGLNSLRLVPGLESLDASGAQRTDSGMWFASITDRGMETIALLPKLQNVNLRGSKISDVGAAQFAKLAVLTRLDLGQTNLTMRGLESLPKQLQWLSLWKCTKVDDTAVEALSQLTKLTWLDLEGTQISPTGEARLRAALPNCQVKR